VNKRHRGKERRVEKESAAWWAMHERKRIKLDRGGLLKRRGKRRKIPKISKKKGGQTTGQLSPTRGRGEKESIENCFGNKSIAIVPQGSVPVILRGREKGATKTHSVGL